MAISDLEFSKIPFAKEVCPCSYYPQKTCKQLYNMTYWYDLSDFLIDDKPVPMKQYYDYLKRHGFCRYSTLAYKYICEKCSQCTPIRVRVKDFKMSKSQRVVWNKNQDIEVTLQKASDKFVSDEKALLFREYDAYHNHNMPGFEKKSLEEAKSMLSDMNSGYEGIWNLEYRLNGRLIGVGIIDYTENGEEKINALCSNYFYYEISEEVEQRSLGVFSVLKEIELCRQLEVPYYYLGLYLNNFQKMNYKTNFKPYELYMDGVWISSDEKLPGPGDLYENDDICFVTEEISLPVLFYAYQNGIFPWFDEDCGDPVIWQSPDPRFAIPIQKLHIPKTIKKFIKHTPYTYTMDKCFETVMQECRDQKREGQNGTWIGPKMLKAYSEFHKAGYAHSIEVWHDEKLVGGFYGILLGSVFLGESMFTKEDNSSSSAFVLFAQAFSECGGRIIDCQAYTANMARYGAVEMPRGEFLKLHKKFQKVRLLKDLESAFLNLANKQS